MYDKNMERKGEAFRYYVLCFLFVFTAAFIYLVTSCFVGEFLRINQTCSYLSDTFLISGVWGIFTIGFYYGGWKGGAASGAALIFIIFLLQWFFRLKLFIGGG
ncbi:MAG: hypothetical protein UY65_C0011G0013 [Parcubacteria group bacterium GW2011_GWA2_51_12]|nr:MAG: hypothetical protein UY65_C0011G0013 [Parcubacteria group bacterium GW2011_GWA2_51_12]